MSTQPHILVADDEKSIRAICISSDCAAERIALAFSCQREQQSSVLAGVHVSASRAAP